MKIKVRIEGVTPMICNKFSDAAALKATSGTSSSAAAGSKGSPREQAETKVYLGVDGKTQIIPGPNLFSCIIAAGSFFKAGKSKITTQKSSLIPACVSIEEIELPIDTKEGWCVDTRAVRNPATGGRFLAYRPIYNDWALECTIDLDESIMDAKLLREIIDAAGKRVGLGDFRPSCKGPYGRFNVTKWETMK